MKELDEVYFVKELVIFYFKSFFETNLVETRSVKILKNVFK